MPILENPGSVKINSKQNGINSIFLKIDIAIQSILLLILVASVATIIMMEVLKIIPYNGYGPATFGFYLGIPLLFIWQSGISANINSYTENRGKIARFYKNTFWIILALTIISIGYVWFTIFGGGFVSYILLTIYFVYYYIFSIQNLISSKN